MRSYIWVLIINPLEGEQLAAVMDDLMLVSVANPVNFWLWSVKLLAGHVDAQRRAQAELDAVFGPPADAASPHRSLSADRTLLPFSLAIFWEVYEENNHTYEFSAETFVLKLYCTAFTVVQLHLFDFDKYCAKTGAAIRFWNHCNVYETGHRGRAHQRILCSARLTAAAALHCYQQRHQDVRSTARLRTRTVPLQWFSF